MNLNSILSEFHATNTEITENFHSLNISISFNNIFILTHDLCNKILNILSCDDKLFSFTIKYDDSNEVIYSENICAFIENLNNQINLLNPQQSTEIFIQINKCKTNSTINIYSIDNFCTYLESANICEILTNLSSKFYHNFITFEIIDALSNINISSNSFIIKSINSSIGRDYIIDNSSKENFRSVCCFLGKVCLNFTPDAFDLPTSQNARIDSFFQKLKIIFSIIYIFDISDLINNNINIKLNGYKNIELNLPINTLNLNNLIIYYDIYKWIYTDGNISDKIGIARNIISLYLTNYNTIELHESVLTAIRSNYTIYLKENVEKYLEVKTKVIDNIFSTNTQISDLINSLTKNFMKNLSVIGTFIATITIMNSLNDKRLTNIFTSEITIISLVLVLISVFYFKYTCKEYDQNKKRIKTLYSRLKESYKDILVPADIGTLFKNDIYFNDDIHEADEKATLYKEYWKWCLFIFEMLVIILGFFF